MSAAKGVRKPPSTEAPAPASATVPDISAAASGISLALDRIEAAAWVLDQIKMGELGFLDRDHEVPCWWSTVAGSAEDLHGTIEQWCVESISRGVQEIRRECKIACPEVVR